MEAKTHSPSYPEKWSVRFLCDCRKEDKEIRIRHGIAFALSPEEVHILSDHAICLNKKVALQLMVPPLHDDALSRIIRIIGYSIETARKDARYLTKVELRHFEEDGRRLLEKSLNQHFGVPDVDTCVRQA